MYNTAIGFMQDAAEAEDVAQEVFIEVHRSLSQFGQRSSLSTWIYRITVNKCIDAIRKKKRRRGNGIFRLFQQEDGEIETEKGHFDHPGILMENKEKARLLFAAIDLLPEQQKTAFLLFHTEDLSHKEIAEVMGTTAKAVESLIQRAKANLRVSLGNYYEKKRGK